jgi:hypothetical protein
MFSDLSPDESPAASAARGDAGILLADDRLVARLESVLDALVKLSLV